MLHHARLEGPARDKHSSLLGPFVTFEENGEFEIRGCIQNFFTNRDIKLECYITLGLKGLPGTNNLAYWGPFVC